MDKFLLICYVAADFVGHGGEIFRIGPNDLGKFIYAPTWIKSTLMYRWLVNDGSLKVSTDAKEQKKLENDPMEGVTVEGKAEEPVAVEVTTEEEEAPKTRKTTRSKKGEAK